MNVKFTKPIGAAYRSRPNALPVAGTFSRDPVMWGKSDSIPTAILSGRGQNVRGADQRTYLDWVCGLGANLLGYGHTGFDARVAMHLREGSVFSIRANIEIEAASRLVSILGQRVPGWDADNIAVRWGLSGSDADSMAVRLARAVTGKFDILRAAYTGWQDWSVASTPPALGVIPEEKNYVHDFEYNNRNSFVDALMRADKAHGRKSVAAVIIEQGPYEPEDNWYQWLREWCNDLGALLIIDEVVTGFRYGIGGVCERYQIKPDLVTYGKGLGNGVPVSALVGGMEYMEWFARESPPFCSSTFWGNAISCSAADAMLAMWTQGHIDHIWQVGSKLVVGLADIGYNVIGHPVRSLVKIDDDVERAWFIAGMAERGILMNRPNFICFAHNENDVARTLVAAAEVREELNTIEHDDMERQLTGLMPRILFRNR